MTFDSVTDGNTSSGFGDIFSTIKDVAGNYFDFRLKKKALDAPPAQYAGQATTYGAGQPWVNPDSRPRKSMNYQAWGVALAAIGTVIAILALVKK